MEEQCIPRPAETSAQLIWNGATVALTVGDTVAAAVIAEISP
jgi:hypothetical protein